MESHSTWIGVSFRSLGDAHPNRSRTTASPEAMLRTATARGSEIGSWESFETGSAVGGDHFRFVASLPVYDETTSGLSRHFRFIAKLLPVCRVTSGLSRNYFRFVASFPVYCETTSGLSPHFRFSAKLLPVCRQFA